MKNKMVFLYLFTIGLLLIAMLGWYIYSYLSQSAVDTVHLDSRRASADMQTQVKTLGYSNEFINKYNYQMIDDHLPFLEVGIPAVDIIDFDYPYWHTIQDTPDKISTQSLQTVGQTLRAWVIQRSGQP